MQGRGGGGQLVRVLTLNSDNMSSNPTHSLFCKNVCLKGTKNKQKEAGVGPFFTISLQKTCKTSEEREEELSIKARERRNLDLVSNLIYQSFLGKKKMTLDEKNKFSWRRRRRRQTTFQKKLSSK